jgi:hypothetical protein
LDLSLFFLSLFKKWPSFKNWLKLYITGENGKTQELSRDNLVKLGDNAKSGDIKIINNYYVAFDANKSSKDYDNNVKNEMIEQVEKLVDEHSAVYFFDINLFIPRNVKLSDTQRNQINKFKSVGWSSDKINSIRVAFKIMNLEDSGSYEDAKELMKSAFDGRKRVMNRKFYNLARAGYLNQFILDILTGGALNSHDKISKYLEYFPPAIFVDEDFLSIDLLKELEKREKDSVKYVAIYSRGKNRIEIMEKAYGGYLKQKISQVENKKNKRIKLYILTRKNSYTIGQTDAESIDLSLEDMELKDLPLFFDML